MAGDGSIFRLKSGKWRAQRSVGGRGSRRYITRTVPTRTEARAALEELRADQRAGVSRSRMLLSDYLERWVSDARNIRDTTRHGYQVVVMHHLIPTIGSVRVADLSPLHVERALATLEPRMSAKSLRNVHAVLRRALGQAVRAGLISRNVASREFVDAPRVTLDDPEAFTSAEVRRLLDAARGDRLEALITVALGTGLRQGELLGLAWQDVTIPTESSHSDERSDAYLTIRFELARVDGAYRRVEPKTDRSRRTVPLAPALVEALQRHRERTIAEGLIPTATGPVFASRTGAPLNGSWVTHRLYALEEVAGIRRLPFKNLRTTFGSRLFEAGVQDLEIAQLLGHARTHTTRRHYIALGDRHATAVDVIERLVG